MIIHPKATIVIGPYKGFYGRVKLHDDRPYFHGEVCKINDVVTFHAERLQDLRGAFRDSIDDYLEMLEPR